MNTEPKKKIEGLCPIHNVIGTFIPPPTEDKQKKQLIVTYQCPNGHTFVEVHDLI